MVAQQQQRIAEHTRLRALEHQRFVAAARLWKAEHGNTDVWPDAAELLQWLTDERAQLQGALKDVMDKHGGW